MPDQQDEAYLHYKAPEQWGDYTPTAMLRLNAGKLEQWMEYSANYGEWVAVPVIGGVE